jgi:hypothetical protein
VADSLQIAHLISSSVSTREDVINIGRNLPTTDSADGITMQDEKTKTLPASAVYPAPLLGRFPESFAPLRIGGKG